MKSIKVYILSENYVIKLYKNAEANKKQQTHHINDGWMNGDNGKKKFQPLLLKSHLMISQVLFFFVFVCFYFFKSSCSMLQTIRLPLMWLVHRGEDDFKKFIFYSRYKHMKPLH